MELKFVDTLNNSGRYDAEQAVVDNFEHLLNDTRSWLKAAGYDRALLAMDIMLENRLGEFRQDGVTPDALHQLTQAIWAISAMEDGFHVESPEDILTLIFLHDEGEDYKLMPSKLKNRFIKDGFPDDERLDTLILDFEIISKRFGKDGEPRYENPHQYFEAVRLSENASVVKLFDRIHNIMTMVDVKSNETIAEYVGGTLVLLKDYIDGACVDFRNQEELYETLEAVLNKTVQVNRYQIYGENVGKPITNDNEELRREIPEKGFGSMPDGLHPLIVCAERIRNLQPQNTIEPNNDNVDQLGTDPQNSEYNR